MGIACINPVFAACHLLRVYFQVGFWFCFWVLEGFFLVVGFFNVATGYALSEFTSCHYCPHRDSEHPEKYLPLICYLLSNNYPDRQVTPTASWCLTCQKSSGPEEKEHTQHQMLFIDFRQILPPPWASVGPQPHSLCENTRVKVLQKCAN